MLVTSNKCQNIWVFRKRCIFVNTLLTEKSYCFFINIFSLISNTFVQSKLFIELTMNCSCTGIPCPFLQNDVHIKTLQLQNSCLCDTMFTVNRVDVRIQCISMITDVGGAALGI